MITLRAERADDWEFVVALYASTRADELAPVDWPQQAKDDFLRSQCQLQHDHYRRYYGGARFEIIERDGRPVGRMYLHETRSETRLMDIALVPQERGQGIGTKLVQEVLDAAASRGVPVTLHVEPENPAQRMYARFGFRLLEERGAYQFLGWDPPDSGVSVAG